MGAPFLWFIFVLTHLKVLQVELIKKDFRTYFWRIYLTIWFSNMFALWYWNNMQTTFCVWRKKNWACIKSQLTNLYASGNDNELAKSPPRNFYPPRPFLIDFMQTDVRKKNWNVHGSEVKFYSKSLTINQQLRSHLLLFGSFQVLDAFQINAPKE